MADKAPVLYSFWRSSCAWRVRTALEWKGVAYTVRPVNILRSGGGEHLEKEFAAINPNQRVPTLLIDGRVLRQSGAILEYLEETRPEKPLLPSDPYSRAIVRNICGIIGSDIQPLQSAAVLAKISESESETQQVAVAATAKAAWGRHWITRGFGALEQELATTAGVFAVGDVVTLADVFLLPQVFNARAMGVDMHAFPTIARVADALETLPAFQRAHPIRQVDAE